MNRLIRWTSFSAWLCAVLLFCASAGAQQNTQSTAQQMRAYDVSREVSMQGTVVSFTENSSTAPLGPHVVIFTSYGQVDTHLGAPCLHKAIPTSLAAGRSPPLVG